MTIIDLYDGEHRTAYWWKVIAINSITTPFFLYFLILLSPYYLSIFGVDIQKAFQIFDMLYKPFLHPQTTVTVLIVITIVCVLFFFLSLILPNLAFSFYYLNTVFFILIWVIGGLLIFLYKATGEDFEITRVAGHELFNILFGIPVLIWVVVVIIKTIIIYQRFRIVTQEGGKRRL